MPAVLTIFQVNLSAEVCVFFRSSIYSRCCILICSAMVGVPHRRTLTTHRRGYLQQLFHGGSRPLDRNVQWFQGGLVLRAHRLLYYSTLGSKTIKEKKKEIVHHPTLCLRVIKQKKRGCLQQLFYGEGAPATTSQVNPSAEQVLNLRTTTLQKCAAVPKRTRI